MNRLVLGLLVILFNLNGESISFAQEESSPPDTPPAPSGSADTTSDLNLLEDLADPLAEGGDTGAKKAAVDPTTRRKAWDDIVVVPRKAFLKKHRLELAPFAGITLNDPLIRHYSFGGDLNFFITDALSVGVEGQYFLKEISERTSLTGLQYYRVPTLNKLKYHAALVFGYVPGYGKFGLFNKYIVHWDITACVGIGMIRTEIIPRQFTDPAFTNQNITPHVGLGARLFVLDWLTLSVSFRDYMYKDIFEPQNRSTLADPLNVALVKQNGDSQFVQNIMMLVSLGFYIPPSFTYKTPR
jgi:outer membrane beta-barrel protein